MLFVPADTPHMVSGPSMMQTTPADSTGGRRSGLAPLVTVAAISLAVASVSRSLQDGNAAPTEPGSDETTLKIATSLTSRAAVHDAVREAADSPRAIVFIQVPYAVTQRHVEQFDEFAMQWHKTHGDFPVEFHRVSFHHACENYEPITDLPGYSEWETNAGHHPFGGNGEWVWIADGRLTDIGSVFGVSNSAITARTESAFSIPAP